MYTSSKSSKSTPSRRGLMFWLSALVPASPETQGSLLRAAAPSMVSSLAVGLEVTSSNSATASGYREAQFSQIVQHQIPPCKSLWMSTLSFPGLSFTYPAQPPPKVPHARLYWALWVAVGQLAELRSQGEAGGPAGKYLPPPTAQQS